MATRVSAIGAKHGSRTTSTSTVDGSTPVESIDSRLLQAYKMTDEDGKDKSKAQLPPKYRTLDVWIDPLFANAEPIATASKTPYSSDTNRSHHARKEDVLDS